MSKPHGFTLVELLIVIAIVALLAAIAFPVTTSFIGKSREAACLGQLRSLGVALQSYLQENSNTLPTLIAGRSSRSEDAPVLDVLLLPYLNSKEAFRCPADGKLFAASGSSYLWNNTQNGRRVTELSFFGIKDRPDKIPLISDKEAWHFEKVNFLLADLSSSNKQRFVAGQ
jgi:prepilin-type N-terminal cleavage/methylation domain-containing protein